jgi:hypothetical protein
MESDREYGNLLVIRPDIEGMTLLLDLWVPLCMNDNSKQGGYTACSAQGKR